MEDSERIFTELIRFTKERRSEVTKMIRDREKTEVRRTEELMKQLEMEIDQMRLINAELEQLSQTHDHIHFPPGCTMIFRLFTAFTAFVIIIDP